MVLGNVKALLNNEHYDCLSDDLIRSHSYCHSMQKQCVYDTRQSLECSECARLEHLYHCAEFECPTMFKCRINYCIPTYMLCDGVRDCPDGDDEASCVNIMCPGLLRCRSDHLCIHPVNICDGFVHCLNSEDDEQLCLLSSCPEKCKCQGQLIKCHSHFPVLLLEINAIRFLLLEKVEFGNWHTFEKCKFLQQMIITNSKFKVNVLPDYLLVGLILLMNLTLAECSLTSIGSSDFRDLHSVQDINLQDNQLHILHQNNFSSLVQLAVLDVSANNILTLKHCPLCGLYVLQTLNLSSNSLTHIKADTFQDLMSIRVLDLRDNPLTDVDFAAIPRSVQRIYVDNQYQCCIILDLKMCLTNQGSTISKVRCAHKLTKNRNLSIFLSLLTTCAIVLNLLSAIHLSKSDMKSSQIILQQHILLMDVIFHVYILGITIALTMNRDNALFLNSVWSNHVFCKVLGTLPAVAFMLTKYEIFLISVNQLIATRFALQKAPLSSSKITCCIIVGWVIAIAYIATSLKKQKDMSMLCYSFTLSNQVNPVIVTMNAIIFSVAIVLTLGMIFNYIVIIKYVKHTSEQVRGSKSTKKNSFLVGYVTCVATFEIINNILIGVLLFYKQNLEYDFTLFIGLFYLGTVHCLIMVVKTMSKQMFC